MELKGIKANFLGDSITEGSGVKNPENRYFERLKTNCQMAECRGYGIGGTHITHSETDFPYEKWNFDFVGRVDLMDPDAQLIVVFGGTNDFERIHILGDMSSRDTTSFYGALHNCFTKIITRYPTATIVVMTPIHRGTEINSKGVTLETYVNIEKQVAAYYGIPVLDLYSVCTIQPSLEIHRTMYCPDKLHPNDDGHAIIASRLEGFLKTL